MILTVTLNPAIDFILETERLRCGEVNLIEREKKLAGGKGVNVSRIVKKLGGETLATGWVGGRTGKELRTLLQKEEIEEDFVPIRGETRKNLTIENRKGEKETHFISPGPRIEQEEMEKLRDKLRKLREESKVIVFSGSLPLGVPENFYAELLELCEDKFTILDTRGEPLKRGIEASPFMIKPNWEELEELRGKKLGEENLQEETEPLLSRVRWIVISRGERGVIFLSRKKKGEVIPFPVPVKNTVGAGDAVVAGFALGIENNLPPEKITTFACACGMVVSEWGRESDFFLSRVKEYEKKIEWEPF